MENITETSGLQQKEKTMYLICLHEKCKITSYKGVNLWNKRTEIL